MAAQGNLIRGGGTVGFRTKTQRIAFRHRGRTGTIQRQVRKYRGLPFDVNYFPSYGQSNSRGATTTNPLDTAFSDDPIDGAYMFGPQMNQGIECSDITPFQTPVPAIETDYTGVGGANDCNETPCRGFAETMLKLIEKRVGRTYAQHGQKILLASLGNGGETIENLVKETGRAFGDDTTAAGATDGRNFGRIERSFTAAKAWADSQNLSSGCPGVQFHWGAAAYPNLLTKAQIVAYLIQLADDLEAAVYTAFGQTSPCYLILSSSHAHKARNTIDPLDMFVAEAMQEAAEMDPRILLGPPQYMNLYEGGEPAPGSNVHNRPSGSKILGAGCAERVFGPLVMGEDDGNFLPSAITRLSGGTLVRLDFNVPDDWELCWEFQTSEKENLRPDPQSGFYVVDTGTTTSLGIKTDATTSAPHLPYIDGPSVFFPTNGALPGTADMTYAPQTYGGNLAMKPRCPAMEIPVVLQSSTVNIKRHCSPFRKAIPA